MLCEISCKVFAVPWLNSACTEIHKNISTAYGGKFFKINFDMVIVIKSNKIYMRNWNAKQNSLFSKWVYTAKLQVYRGTQKNNNTSRSKKRIFSKSVLT